MSNSNIGRFCKVGSCKLIYAIEGYSSQPEQYLLRLAQSVNEDCLVLGWVDANLVSVLPGSPDGSAMDLMRLINELRTIN